MMLLGFRHLALVLIVTLLFCHGVFGSMHLLCYSRQCPGDAEHAMEHNTSVSEMGDGPEHPVGQVASEGNFAMLAVGFLGLPLGSLPKVAPQTRSVREE